jgi:hypothetical protein
MFQQAKYMREGEEYSEKIGKRKIVVGMLPVLRPKKTNN